LCLLILLKNLKMPTKFRSWRLWKKHSRKQLRKLITKELHLLEGLTSSKAKALPAAKQFKI